MAWSWRIQKASVEQVILFPSEISYNAYIAEMARRGEPCELLQTNYNDDGTVQALVRKRYNHNAFLSNGDRNAMLETDGEVDSDADIQN